jgi:hypothetical protein
MSTFTSLIAASARCRGKYTAENQALISCGCRTWTRSRFSPSTPASTTGPVIMFAIHRAFVLILFSALLIFTPPVSAQRKADSMQQIVFGGSMTAIIRAPVGWSYFAPSPLEMERNHIVAAYKPIDVPIETAHAYVTLIPVELRKPESLASEIEHDKRMSIADGLKFYKTETLAAAAGDSVAINTWSGAGFRSYVGIYPTKNGLLMIVGNSRSKNSDARVYEGVKSLLKSATISPLKMLGR